MFTIEKDHFNDLIDLFKEVHFEQVFLRQYDQQKLMRINNTVKLS